MIQWTLSLTSRNTAISEQTPALLLAFFFIICTYIFKNFYDSLLFFPQGKEKKKHNKVLLHKPYLYFSGNLGVKLFYSEKK